METPGSPAADTLFIGGGPWPEAPGTVAGQSIPRTAFKGRAGRKANPTFRLRLLVEGQGSGRRPPVPGRPGQPLRLIASGHRRQQQQEEAADGKRGHPQPQPGPEQSPGHLGRTSKEMLFRLAPSFSLILRSTATALHRQVEEGNWCGRWMRTACRRWTRLYRPLQV